MDFSEICIYNYDVDPINDFLSDNSNVKAILRYGRRVAVSMGQDTESAEDIAIEAFEQVYEWIKRPYSYLSFKDFTFERMKNFIYKAIKSRCINILKRENRHLKKVKEFWEKIKNGRIIGPEGEITTAETPGNTGSSDDLVKRMGAFAVDLNNITLKDLKADIHFFIEEKFGRATWKHKKFTVDIFFERFENDLTIKDLKEKYPGKKISSLNTEAHRIIKSYIKWLEKSVQSRLVESHVIWGIND